MIPFFFFTASQTFNIRSLLVALNVSKELENIIDCDWIKHQIQFTQFNLHNDFRILKVRRVKIKDINVNRDKFLTRLIYKNRLLHPDIFINCKLAESES